MRNLASLAAVLLLAACATTQAPASPAGPAPVEVKATGTPGEAAATQTERLSAKVTAVDAKARTLTVTDESGASETVKVPPEVKRFGEIAVGDTIHVVLTRGLLLEYQPAGSETVEPQAAAVGGRVAPGAGQPGGAVAAAVQGTVTVTAIDLKTRVVAFQGPGGQVYKVKAGPGLQIEKLKVGDRLLATYAEALAIEVEKGGTKL